MAAVILGTALSALAPAPARAEAAQPGDAVVADLGRYCTPCWRNARLPVSNWADCTQEVFRRLLERVPPAAWTNVLGQESEEHREFLRAIDAVKKRVQRARKYSAALDGVADRRDLDARRLDDEREAVRRVAAEALSPRQQDILRLSFEGWSVHDIADHLGLAPERVSDEKYKAVRKLRARLAEMPEAAPALAVA